MISTSRCPKAIAAIASSEFIKAFILMQHEGSFHLDDIRHIHDDEALRTVLGSKTLPRATTLGDWVKVNRAVLKSALQRCKKVTLDIDATEIVAHKVGAKWTYNKNKGFMPMVGHLAETGQIVAVDFRQGKAVRGQKTVRIALKS